MDKIILCKIQGKPFKNHLTTLNTINTDLLTLEASYTHFRFMIAINHVLFSNSFIAELSATSTGRQPSLSTIEQSAPDCKSSFTIERKSQVVAVI